MKNKSITNMTNIRYEKDEPKNIKPLIYLENVLKSISKIFKYENPRRFSPNKTFWNYSIEKRDSWRSVPVLLMHYHVSRKIKCRFN